MGATSEWVINLKHQHKDLLLINQIYFETLCSYEKESVTIDCNTNIVKS